MNKRKVYFKVFDPVLQRDVLLYLGALWAIWLTLQSFFVYAVLFTDGFELGGEFDRAQAIIMGSLVFSSILFLSIVLLFNRFLLRLTGPIHRIQTDLESFIAGKASEPTQLRRGDYFQELSETINKVVLRAKSVESGDSLARKTE